MKTPDFWYQNHLFGFLLTPFSWIYQSMAYLHQKTKTSKKVNVPVICVGNVVMGGAGKTPTVLALAEILKEHGKNPHILSRGYKGKSPTYPLKVDPDNHTFQEVGDEPLLLSQVAPTWVFKDRFLAAQKAIQEGADILLMDDGLQNPSLYKDLSLLVTDVSQGFGNRHLFPAGPLREPVQKAIQKCQGIIQIGIGEIKEIKGPIIAHLEVIEKPHKKRIIGFSGLGFHKKFLCTLVQEGFEVKEFISFPDHYRYTVGDIKKLLKFSQKHQAVLVTTFKDWIRLPKEFQSFIQIVKIKLVFDDHKRMLQLLAPYID